MTEFPVGHEVIGDEEDKEVFYTFKVGDKEVSVPVVNTMINFKTFIERLLTGNKRTRQLGEELVSLQGDLGGQQLLLESGFQRNFVYRYKLELSVQHLENRTPKKEATKTVAEHVEKIESRAPEKPVVEEKVISPAAKKEPCMPQDTPPSQAQSILSQRTCGGAAASGEDEEESLEEDHTPKKTDKINQTSEPPKEDHTPKKTDKIVTQSPKTKTTPLMPIDEWINRLKTNVDDIPLRNSELEHVKIVHNRLKDADDEELVNLGKQYVEIENEKQRGLYYAQYFIGQIADAANRQWNNDLLNDKKIDPRFEQFCADIGKKPTTVIKKYIPFYRFLKDYPLMLCVTNTTMTKVNQYRTKAIKYFKSCDEDVSKRWCRVAVE